jgi:hypothetical protein
MDIPGRRIAVRGGGFAAIHVVSKFAPPVPVGAVATTAPRGVARTRSQGRQ